MEDTKYDAILCPRDFPHHAGQDGTISLGAGGFQAKGTLEDKHNARKRILGPILGSRRVESREAIGKSLVTRGGDFTGFLFPSFPTKHPRNPELRHIWYEASFEGNALVVGDEVPEDGLDSHEILVGVLKKDE